MPPDLLGLDGAGAARAGGRGSQGIDNLNNLGLVNQRSKAAGLGFRLPTEAEHLSLCARAHHNDMGGIG